LLEAELGSEAAAIRFRLMMLTDAYELAALTLATPSGNDAVLAAVAQGAVPADPPLPGALRPVQAAFQDGAADQALVEMARDGRLGEAILRTISVFDQGLNGDEAALREALATLRALGLEDTARRAALEYLVLRAL